MRKQIACHVMGPATPEFPGDVGPSLSEIGQANLACTDCHGADKGASRWIRGQYLGKETERMELYATLRRRSLLIAAGGLACLARAAAATPEEAARLLEQFLGGKTPEAGKIGLELPPIAENGNTVPITVAVESPMTEEDHVDAIWILAEANPEPAVAVFHLSPLMGRAEVSTRIRLARTQTVIAAARTSAGAVHVARVQVKVTIGGCGG
jgi:sulfur-oxidizing protein SoxY